MVNEPEELWSTALKLKLWWIPNETKAAKIWLWNKQLLDRIGAWHSEEFCLSVLFNSSLVCLDQFLSDWIKK